MDPLETPALRLQLLEELVSEAIEHLDVADAVLDAADRDVLDDEARAEFMRAMHTIKGSAAYMGLADIQGLAHALESIAQQATEDVGGAAVRLDLLQAGIAELRDLVEHADAPRPATAGLLAALRGAETRPATPAARRRPSIAEIFLGVVQQQCQALRAAKLLLAEPRGKAGIADGHRMALRALATLRSAASYAGRADVLLLLGDAPESDAAASVDDDTITRLLDSLAVIVSGMVTFDAADGSATAGRSSDPQGEPAPMVDGAGEAGTNGVPVDPIDGPVDMTAPAGASGTLRVPVARVDALIGQVGELLSIGRQLEHFLGQVENEGCIPSLTRQGRLLSASFDRSVDELQNTAHELRLVRLETVFRRLPRICRDAAVHTAKQVRLELLGGDTEVDKTVAEALADPLLHMIRNAIDHGIERPAERRAAAKIETGTVVVAARQELAEVIIDVRDDGRGLDEQKVRSRAVDAGLLDADTAARLSSDEVLELLFRPGISTAASVTELSGRGVGLDVVRAKVRQLGGKISVRNLSPGTAFELRFPVRLAVTDVVLVRAAGAIFAVALDGVLETLSVGTGGVHRVAGRPVIVHQGRVVPLVSLAEAVGLGDGETDAAVGSEVIIVDVAGQPVGLAIDEIDRHQKIVVKPLASYLARPGLSDAAILGDGTVVLVVAPGLLIAQTLAATPATG